MTQTIYVNTDATGGTYDGTTIGTAYLTLDAAIEELVGIGTLTEHIIIYCSASSGTADTTAAAPSGVIDGAFDVSIIADPTNTGGKNDGGPTISTSYYRIDVGTDVKGLDISTNWQCASVTVDGIQVLNAGTNVYAPAICTQATACDITVQNCRLRYKSASQGVGLGTPLSVINSAKTISFINNVVLGFRHVIRIDVSSLASLTWNVFNNVAYDGTYGIVLVTNNGTTATYNLHNNVSANNATNDLYTGTVYGTLTKTYNSSDDTPFVGDTGSVSIGTHADAWVDPGGLDSSDFTLKGTGSPLYQAGDTISGAAPTTDINGVTRHATTPCMGPFELVVASGSTFHSGMNLMGAGV